MYGGNLFNKISTSFLYNEYTVFKMNEYFQFCKLSPRQWDAAVREEQKLNVNLHTAFITCHYLRFMFPCCDTKFIVVFETSECISRATLVFHRYFVLFPHQLENQESFCRWKTDLSWIKACATLALSKHSTRAWRSPKMKPGIK